MPKTELERGDSPSKFETEKLRPRAAALWGTFKREERWGLSWKGRLLLVALVLLLSAVLVVTIFPFLSVTQRVSSDVLVVEGWIPQYAIHAAAGEFVAGNYTRVFTTGGPVVGMGGYTNDYNTSANVGAGRLRAEGLSKELVQMVPSRVVSRDRTYGSAVALRDWFRANDVHVHGINVVTEAPHARRTQLLFQRAFGSQIRVGVIGIQNPDYDPRRWWRYSEGVKDVVGETMALVYAEFFFRPSTDGK